MFRRTIALGNETEDMLCQPQYPFTTGGAGDVFVDENI